ncbi:TlpA family protein disulfide reductase [Flavobacterium orientale]|uniref:Thioredoxin domain-containing protein n=1 Tax=Flavobacterium orientale TaxID=1756020 RepID=A0A916YA66_9FLAO|nr:TlpA disulfide reductase family protein [Flavobacterium orientale]GGD36599.1 hypothetical protein GCM10011343_28060 [Flavobacterium orientale]
MKIRIAILLVCFFSLTSLAQNKKLWAKSYIDKKAPELVVEEWISEKPNTEGKFILIDFWATWCAPCKRAIPELNDFQEKFKTDLVIIGISDQTKDVIVNFNAPKIEYFSAIDTKKVLKNLYEVVGIPHCVLIDPKGIVRWEGYPSLEGHELTEKVINDIISKYK